MELFGHLFLFIIFFGLLGLGGFNAFLGLDMRIGGVFWGISLFDADSVGFICRMA